MAAMLKASEGVLVEVSVDIVINQFAGQRMTADRALHMLNDELMLLPRSAD
jgi:hypothetical protein